MNKIINDIVQLNLDIKKLEIERENQLKYYEIAIDNLISQRAKLEQQLQKTNTNTKETGEEFPPILKL